MQEGQVKSVPRYGVVYPDGITAVKVIRTYTGGSYRTYNPDGSVTHSIPPPTIHELYSGNMDEKGKIICGGFAYADGKPVTIREHLEHIDALDMKKRAMEWFDSRAGISQKALSPDTRDPNEPAKRPDPLFIVSGDADMPELDKGFEVREEVREVEQPKKEPDIFTQILSVVQGISETIKAQDQRIHNLENNINPLTLSRKKNSAKMKDKWADPEFREKMTKKIQERAAARKMKNGKDVPQTTKAV